MLVFSLPSLLACAWKQRLPLAGSQTWHPLLVPLVLVGLAVFMAGSIGIARVFVGVHYPGDILRSALSGLGAAGIVMALRHPLRVPTEALLRVVAQLHVV